MSVLNPLGDPMGAAIYDYHKTGKADTLVVRSSMFDDDEIPVADLFRTFKDMPRLEQIALEMAQGRILDVGAGSGCHSLELIKMGKEAVAIDISPLSVNVMFERGIPARQVNFYNPSFDERFDTVLMLMNGTGIIGNLENIYHIGHMSGKRRKRLFNTLLIANISKYPIKNSNLTSLLGGNHKTAHSHKCQ